MQPRIALTLFATAAFALPLGCDDESSTATPDAAMAPDAAPGTVTRQQVLAHLATEVFVPATAEFADRAAELRTAVDAWAAAGGDEGEALDAARDAWRAAMRSWQFAELLRAGPAGEARSYVGGEGLRDRIYSWPTARPCGVDQNIVAERYTEANFTTAQLVNVLGLDALEYLLFYTGADNDCPSQVEINTSGSWSALDAAELQRRRAAYAAVIAAQVATDGDALRAAWATSGGDFAGKLAAAGDGAPYTTAHEALEQVFHGLFYLDKISKDLKLAIPTGLSPDCASATGCPADLETPWAGFARESLEANVRAGRALFVGGLDGQDDGPGYDDLLVAAGAADLAEEMRADFDAAITALEGSEPLDRLIADDLDAAQALHGRLKTITDALKSRFVSVLDLDVPASGAADND